MCSLDEEFSYFKQMFFLTLTYFGVEPKMLCKYCKHIYSPTDLFRDIFQLTFKEAFVEFFKMVLYSKGVLLDSQQ